MRAQRESVEGTAPTSRSRSGSGMRVSPHAPKWIPLGAVPTSTWVATFSACQSSICALLAMKLYSRRDHPGDEDLSRGTRREAGS